MLPLSMAKIGEENTVVKIGGNSEVKKHLEDLGFVIGGKVSVVSSMCGNIIVNVKNSRIAVSEEIAKKIMV